MTKKWLTILIIAKIAITKFFRHFSYLGDECVALDIFVERIYLEFRNNLFHRLLLEKEIKEDLKNKIKLEYII